MTPFRDNVGRLRRKLAVLLSARNGLVSFSAVGFACGTVILALRVLAPSLGPHLPWLGWSAVPAAVIAVAMALRQLPSQRALRALIDRYNQAGGLVMAAGEVPLGDWAQRVDRPRVPVLVWRPWKRSAVLAASVAFVVVSLIVPADLGGAMAPRRLNVEHQAATLAQQVQMLQQQKVLAESKAQQVLDKLEQIRRDADASDPARSWEALDHIRQQLAQEASKSAEQAMAARESLAKAQEAANSAAQSNPAASQPSGQMAGNSSTSQSSGGAAQSPSTQPSAQLADALEKAVQSGALSENLGNGLSTSQLAQAAAGGSLSAEQMAQLASAMGQSQRQIDQRLAQLANSRMLDPKLAQEIAQMCKGCQGVGGESPGDGQGQGQVADLSDGPPANEGNPDQTARDGGAGRGGNDRGRGDAAMVWDNGADPTGVAFKEQALPPASLAGLKDSMTIGLGRADPTAERSGASGGGALSGSAGGPGSAYTHQVLPRHRATVGRYFERQSQPPPPQK